MIEVSPEEFERLVEKALDGLPEQFAQLLDNVVIAVEDEPSDDDLISVGLDPEKDDLLGLYEGVSQYDRGADYGGVLPDRVVLFRLPILWICETRDDVVKEVTDTLVHELGHHFGLGEDDMPY